MRALTISLLPCVLLTLSCGGAKSSSVTTGLLSGNWQIGLQPNSSSASTPTESGFLLQSAKSLSGEFLFSGQAQCAGLGSAQGTLTGGDVLMTITQTGQIVTLTGTAAPDGSTMGGTYTIRDSGCGAGSSSGTWSANPVKAVSGTYQATFSSYTLGVYTSTVTVTQGANTGASVVAISGTATSSNAPCGNNLIVGGAVGGTSIVFNFLSSGGTAVGQFTGTTSTDAKTLSGTFDFLAEGGMASCLSGDAGTITLVQK